MSGCVVYIYIFFFGVLKCLEGLSLKDQGLFLFMQLCEHCKSFTGDMIKLR